MALMEPFIILFGSAKSITNICLRIPISFVLATDESSLESLVTVDSTCYDTFLRQYFIILLDSITNNLFVRLQLHSRVHGIYGQQNFTNMCSEQKFHETKNKSWKQFEFNLASDIIQFLTNEGIKQTQIKNLSLAQIYYRQARSLKEWTMSFVKAQPCHILIIPLNTTQENLTKSYERLQNICMKLGGPSIIIHTLDQYIPIGNNTQLNMIPYSQALFNNENPNYICELIKKLSPIRLYLYGNEQNITSEWSKLMIQQETDLMNDEDNWCAFIENELINDNIKWNITSIFEEKLKIHRLTPINLDNLDKNLRFDSALQRSLKTFSERQITVTAEIFYWFDKCIRDGYIQLEPKLTNQQQDKFRNDKDNDDIIITHDPFQYLPENHSNPFEVLKDCIFIWLDEDSYNFKDHLRELIKPSTWYFFNDIPNCLEHIRVQTQNNKKIFLVTSNSLGFRLFLTYSSLMSSILYVYIFGSEFDLHNQWMKNYSRIRRINNDSTQLAKYIKEDVNQYRESQWINNKYRLSSNENNICLETNEQSSTISCPFIVYNLGQTNEFSAYQHTIDYIIGLPRTIDAREEMISECREVFKDNQKALQQIDMFEISYNSNAAIQWYSHESFLFRIINQTLRSNDLNAMYKIRYFIKDLYEQLNEVYKQQLSNDLFLQPTWQKVYRGQQISKRDFEFLQQNQGEIISIRTFLSTTISLQIALCFVIPMPLDDDMISVIFSIEISRSTQQSIRPYANISQFSMFAVEEEILFAMGSAFRIQAIGMLDSADNIPVIHLTLINPGNLE